LGGGFYLSIFHSAVIAGHLADDRARLADEVEVRRRTEAAYRESEAALRRTNAEVEERVRERTARLAEANRRLEDEAEERGRVETALRQSEQWYRSLAEASGEVIYIGARDDTVVYVNSEAGRQLGLTPDKIIGRKRAELFPPQVEQGQRASLAHVFESGEPRRLEHRAMFHGESAWQDTFLIPLRDESGTVAAVMGVSRDITARKTAETGLQDRLAMEEMVSKLAARLVGVGAADVDREIRYGLSVVGQFMKADRSSIIHFGPDASTIMRMDEWCAPGVASQIDNLLGTDMARLKWIMNQLRRGEIVIINSTKGMPSEAQAERENHEQRSVRAAILVPMRSGNRLHGILGTVMHRSERQWAESDVRLLHLVANVFISAFDRAQASAMLEANERKYRTVLENLRDAVYRVSLPDGISEYVSPSAREVFGYSAEQFMETPNFLARIIHPDFAALLKEWWNAVKAGESDQIYEYKVIDPEGKERWIFQSNTVIVDESGKPVAAEGVCRNTTGEHTAQRLIGEQRAKLIESQKMSMLGEMAANIAHEINNPLAIISGSAEQMQKAVRLGMLSEEMGVQLSETIMRNATRIQTIIKGLRNLSRDSTHDPFRETRLHNIIEDTESVCRERFASYDVKLQVGPVAKSLHVECLATQIMEVLVNLLSNALHAVEHVPERWVSLSVQDLGDDVEIAVMDSGPGIPPDVEKALFERFATTKELGKGTGLGLSISRRIIQSHAGTLSYDRSTGHTRFAVRLPKRHREGPI
ncbi:MAG: PAS domain S-box protein, partial [Candidatus Hydrogenedentes bacterium]|nr:PAS domain S-box protein [Candidatus Hydrogenedentota bacterium]